MKQFFFFLTFALLFQTAKAQGFTSLWQKSYGGTGIEYAYSSVVTAGNGALIVGYSKSNNGDVTDHHGAADSADAWVIKTDSLGNKLWAKSYGGSKEDFFTSVANAPGNGFICTGSTRSSDGDLTQNSGGRDLWIVRLDADGNIMWSKTFGDGNDDIGRQVITTKDGGFAVCGTYHTFSQSSLCIRKYNASGTIVSSTYHGGITESNNGYGIVEMPDGAFTAVGTTTVTTTGIGGLPCYKSRGFARRINHLPGNHNSWVYEMSGQDNCGSYRELVNFTGARLLPNNNILVFASIWTSQSATVTNQFLVLDQNTGIPLQYSPQMPTNNSSFGSSNAMLVIDNSNFASIFNTGEIQRFTAPPIPNGAFSPSFPASQPLSLAEYPAINLIYPDNYFVSGSRLNDFSLVRVRSAFNTIGGKVFRDLNQNQVQDNNEPYFSDGWLEVTKPGGATLRLYPSAGQYIVAADTGSFNTRFVPAKPYFSVTPVQKLTSFGNNYYRTDTANFAVTALPGMRDYVVGAIPLSAARPGFTATYSASVRNQAIDTLINKPLRMVKDSRLGFISATPPPTSIVGDTITWNIAQLLPEEKKDFQVLLQVPLIPIVTLADTLKSVFSIDTAGDIFKANNISAINQRVTGSYDPNDKFENHGGTVERQALLNGEELLYTIRFQNTGNDTAFKVVIRDTLDAKLDPATLSMEKASHPYNLQLQYGNILVWTFDNILLPDSNVNEPASNGFLSFRIRAKNTVADGDTLKNRSAIYFDFNPPIITNMVTTVVGSKIPQPVMANVANLYCNLQGQQTGKLTNPPANTTISVLLDGQPLVYTPADSLFRFDVSSLAEGNHEIKAKYTNNNGSDSAMKPFTVNRFVQAVINTPDQAVCKLSGAINLQANTNVNWSGPGTSGSSFNPATAGVGVHRIVATKTNGNCPDSKDTLTITVDDFVQAVITTPDQSICKLSGAINLQANTTVSWVGPGVSGTSFNPLTAGVGTHRIIATKTNGTCPDSKDTLTITVDDFVQAVISTPNQTVCKLSGAINLQANTNVSWSGPGVSSSTFNPANAGVGVHRIVATKTNGTCPDSKDTLTITVDDFVQALINTPDQTVCKLSGSINLLANTNVNWSGPGVSSSTFNPANAGVGVHRIVATKTNGTCPDSKDTLTITVDDFIKPVVLNNDTTICQLAPSFVLRSNVSVSWSGPGTGGGSFNPITAGPGTHLVVASKSNGTCPDGKDTLLVTVRAAITPVVNVTASVATLSNAAAFSNITAVNTSGGGTAPLFTFAKDAAFTQVLQAESATPTLRVLPQMLNVGGNTVYVRMRTSSDCYTTAAAVASVQLQLDVNTPVRSELDKALKVFPNPNNGRFGFRFETGVNDVVRALVLDMNGKQVFEANYGQVAQYYFGKEIILRRPQGEYVLVLYVGNERLQRKIMLTN